jgi:hypothetical protein
MGDINSGYQVLALRNQPSKLFNTLATTDGVGPMIGKGLGRFHLY